MAHDHTHLNRYCGWLWGHQRSYGQQALKTDSSVPLGEGGGAPECTLPASASADRLPLLLRHLPLFACPFMPRHPHLLSLLLRGCPCSWSPSSTGLPASSLPTTAVWERTRVRPPAPGTQRTHRVDALPEAWLRRLRGPTFVSGLFGASPGPEWSPRTLGRGARGEGRRRACMRAHRLWATLHTPGPSSTPSSLPPPPPPPLASPPPPLAAPSPPPPPTPPHHLSGPAYPLSDPSPYPTTNQPSLGMGLDRVGVQVGGSDGRKGG